MQRSFSQVRYLLGAVAICWVAAGLTSAQELTLDAVAHARRIAKGFAANKAKFDNYQCQVELQQGQSTSLRDAVEQGPQREVITAQATLKVAGQDLYYVPEGDKKIVTDPDTLVASGTFVPLSILSNGKQSLTINHLSQYAALRSSWEGIDYTTWNGAGAIHSGHEGQLDRQIDLALKAAAQGHASLVVARDVDYQGTKVTKLAITANATPADVTTIYLIDEQRGFIPLETRALTTFNMEVQKVYVTDIREFPNSGWFPLRCVAIWRKPRLDNEFHTVREIKIKNLDLFQPPREAFTISVPRGTKLDNERNGQITRIAQPMQVDVTQLERLYRQL